MAMFNFQQAKEPLVCVERKCGKGKGKIGRFSRFSPNWRSFKINKAGLVSTIYQEHTLSHIEKRECSFYTNPGHQGFRACFLEKF